MLECDWWTSEQSRDFPDPPDFRFHADNSGKSWKQGRIRNKKSKKKTTKQTAAALSSILTFSFGLLLRLHSFTLWNHEKNEKTNKQTEQEVAPRLFKTLELEFVYSSDLFSDALLWPFWKVLEKNENLYFDSKNVLHLPL